jgi:uncharacterized protein YbaR (Trm112 family)
MNDAIEQPETFAPIVTIRTFLGDKLHPPTTPAEQLLVTTVRASIAALFDEERADFPWLLRLFLPLIQWFYTWRMIAHLRSIRPDPTAALAAFQTLQEKEAAQLAAELARPPNQTRPISQDLLDLVRCPKDRQPLEQWADDQGTIWLVNPRLGYQYPVVDGIPLLIEKEAKQLSPTYHTGGHK